MPIYLQREAEGNLRYIRATMERATTVSSISGVGGMLMGVVGLVAGSAGLRAESGTAAPLLPWLVAAVVAIVVGVAASVSKTHGAGETLLGDATRRFLTCLVPNLLVGAVLTALFWTRGLFDLVPALWMLCYGAGVLAAGTYTVPPVRWMGGGFVALGVVASQLPAYGQHLLIASFGVMHVVFGWVVARRYGG